MDPPIPYYPVNEFGPLMKGLVIGGVGILHVFLAQFAIGGGMLLYHFERVAQRGDADARAFVDGYFKVLVLVSFVLGALTGVAMWFTTIQVGARTIGLMVDEFHWLWATEWVWFSIEIVAGYAFYRFGPDLSGPARRRLLGLYALAAWMSLFWINGILSWQLTPGRWLEGGGVWAGFGNPSFLPSLLFRTAVAAALAGLVACIVINAMELDRPRRAALIRRAARFAAPVAAMPLLALWYFAVLPEDSRAWLSGGSLPMTMFAGVAAGASLLIGGYAIVGILARRLYVNGATATLLLALAFGATAAGEFVREGARKPYTVRGVLYSTSLTPAEVARLRVRGATTDDPYPLRDEARYPTAQLVRGAKVHRALCDAGAGVAPRLVLWLGAMGALFAAIAVWWERGDGRRRLAAIALAGLAVAGLGATWLALGGGAAPDAARGWLYLALAAAALTAGAWLWTWRSPDGAAPTVVAGATAAALLAGAVVREAPRIALLEPPRPSAAGAGGLPLFVATLALGALAIAWIVRLVRESGGAAAEDARTDDDRGR